MAVSLSSDSLLKVVAALLSRVFVRCKRTMPPKRKRGASESEGPGPLLGRFGTSLKCGIVGLPNVG